MKRNIQSFQNLLPLIVILVLAALLRTYKLNELLVFRADQGSEFLLAREALITKKLPLRGLESGVTGIHQGPFFTWVVALIFSIAGFKPEPVALVSAILGIISVWLIYLVAESHWGKPAAFVSSLMFAASPLAVVYGRMPSHTSLVPVGMLVFLITLIQLASAKTQDALKWIFLSFLTWGLLVQIKVSTFPAVLLIPIAFWLSSAKIPTSKKNAAPSLSLIKRLSLKRIILWVLLGIAIPMLPRMLLYLRQDFSEASTLGTLVADRVLSFISAWPETSASATLLLYEYTRKFIVWGSGSITFVMLLIALLLTVKRIPKLIDEPQVEPLPSLLLSFSVIFFLALVLYGKPTEGQFLILSPLIALWFGWALTAGRLPKLAKNWAVVATSLVALFNATFLVSESFLVSVPNVPNRHPYQTFGLPLIERQRIVDQIIKDSSKTPFSLIGFKTAEAETGDLDNFKFLFLREAAPLVEDSRLVYTIVEGERLRRGRKMRIFHFQGAAVIRDEPKPSSYN